MYRHFDLLTPILVIKALSVVSRKIGNITSDVLGMSYNYNDTGSLVILVSHKITLFMPVALMDYL